MKKQIKTKVKTKTGVGVALLAIAGVAAAAAAISMAALPAKLSVQTNPAIVASESTKGSKNQMLAFDLTASSGAAQVSQLSFGIMGDDDANFSTIQNDVAIADYITSCQLTDSSGLVVSTSGIGSTTPQVIFGGLGIRIRRAQTLTYTVSCQFSNTDPTNGNEDAFALFIPSESYITASAAGTSLSGSTLDIGNRFDSGVNTDGRVSVTISGGGNLEAFLDSSSPADSIILGSTTGMEVGVWRFVATGEDFTIDTMQFDNGGEDSVVDTVHLNCEDVGGNSLIYSGYLSDSRIVFNGLDCYAEEGNEALVSISLDTDRVDSYNDGEFVQMVFNATEGDFEAIGMSSGTTFDETDLAQILPANNFTLYTTKPTVTLSSGSPSGAGIIPGFTETLRFNVAADSRGDVELEGLTFKVNSTDENASGWNNCENLGSGTKWNLYDAEDFSTPLGGSSDWFFLDDSVYDDACTIGENLNYVIFSLNAGSPSETIVIPAGSTTTFVLKTDTTGASAVSDDSFRIDIPGESTAEDLAEDCVDGTGDECYTFDFIDSSDDGVDEETLRSLVWGDGILDELDGSLIQSLPIYGGTITY